MLKEFSYSLIAVFYIFGPAFGWQHLPLFRNADGPIAAASVFGGLVILALVQILVMRERPNNAAS